MKQGIVRKIKETRKKALALSVKLNGPGIVGFNSHFSNIKGNKIIMVNNVGQRVKKAS